MDVDSAVSASPVRTKVLSIVGPGRSGTTILASVLGEVHGVTSAGEVRWLWLRGVLEQRSCACALPPAQCPLWSVVLDRVLGSRAADDGGDSPAVREILAAQRDLGTLLNRWRLMRSVGGHGKAWPALLRMQAANGEVISTLAERTQAELIVETSKRAQDAAVFASMDSIDHYVLHVVRDPRAVAYSWRRKKPTGPGMARRTMSTRRLLPSAKRWAENCVGAELLRRQIPRDRWLFIRYEDFSNVPRATVDRVLEFLDVDAKAPFDDADTVTLRPNHIVAGNPSRFRTGPVQIVPDSEWQSRMTRRDQLSVTGLLLPLMLRYGYSARVPR
ncbi:MAG: sulfotransferase [Geodermatophilaceae bacterium]